MFLETQEGLLRGCQNLKASLLLFVGLYSDDHRNRDIFSVNCSFSSCINPNAGNCSIGYSLPPRQLPWTKNVSFHLAQNIFKYIFYF